MKTTLITSLFFAGAFAAPVAPTKRDLGQLRGVVSKAEGIIANIQATVNGAVSSGTKADDIVPGISSQLTDLSQTLSTINVAGDIGADVAIDAAADIGADVTASVGATISAGLSAILGLAADVDIDATAAVDLLADVSVGANLIADLVVKFSSMTDLMTTVPGLVSTVNGAATGVIDGAVPRDVPVVSDLDVEGTLDAAVDIAASINIDVVADIFVQLTGALNILGRFGSLRRVVPV